MGFLKSVVKGIGKVTGGINKGITGAVKQLPGGNTINKTLGKLPGPGKVTAKGSTTPPLPAKIKLAAPPPAVEAGVKGAVRRGIPRNPYAKTA